MFGSGLFQPMHLLLILIVVLIVFGPGKLPDVGKAIGKSIKEFRSASTKKKDAEIQEPVQEQIVAATTTEIKTKNEHNDVIGTK